MRLASFLLRRAIMIASICGVSLFLPGCGKAPLVDIHGDELPSGAIARLGTTRLRPERSIWRLAYSPNGKWIASASMSGSIPSIVEIWEVATGSRWGVLTTEASVDTSTIYSIAWSSDSTQILVGRSGKVQVWNVASLKFLGEVQIADSNQSSSGPIALWIPNSDRIVGFMSPSNKLHIWDAATRNAARVVEADKVLSINSLGRPAQMTRDGRKLVLGQSNGIAIVDIETGQVKTIDLKLWDVVSLSISTDGRKCAVGMRNSLLNLFPNLSNRESAESESGDRVAVVDMDTGEVEGKQEWESRSIGEVAFAEADQVVIATPSFSGSMKCFDTQSGKERWSITAPGVVGHALAIHPNGNEIATGDTAIGFWSVRDGAPVREIGSHTSIIVRLMMDADEETVHTVGADSRCIWNRATGKLVARTPYPPGSLRFDEDKGQRFLRVGSEQTVELVSGDGKTLWSLSPVEDFPADAVLKKVAWSLDGRRVAGSFTSQKLDKQGGEILILDAADGKLLGRISAQSEVWSLKFSPNGRMLGWAAPNVRVWDIDANHLALLSLSSVSLLAGAFAFSPDSSHVVLPISDDGACNQLRSQGKSPTPADPCTAIELWDIEKKEQNWQSQPAGVVSALAVSPDKKFVASATWESDYPVYVWSLKTGKKLARLGGHRDLVRALEFSQDGRTLVSAGQDTTGLVWDLKDLR